MLQAEADAKDPRRMPRGSDKAEKPPGNWPGMKTDRLAGDFTEDVPASTQRSGGDSAFPTGFMVPCGAHCLLGCSCDNIFKPCPGDSRSTQESPASCVLRVAPSVSEAVMCMALCNILKDGRNVL
jgi:hypothetical protein